MGLQQRLASRLRRPPSDLPVPDNLALWPGYLLRLRNPLIRLHLRQNRRPPPQISQEPNEP